MLRALATDRRPRGISELARELGMHKSTLRDVLLTLLRYDFVARDDEMRFSLGRGLWVLTANAPDVRLLAHPYLERLVEEFDETSILGIAVPPRLLLASAVESRAEFHTSVNVGRHIPLSTSCVGDVLVQRKRLAFDNEEYQRGFRAVAGVILGPRRARVACIIVAGPTPRLHARRLSLIGERVLEYSQAISGQLSNTAGGSTA